MGEFEFLFSFFGLLIGLTVAELATKFADAIDAHKRRPIGLLTPLLALFVLLDVTAFWLYAWSLRDFVHISWRTVFSALTIAILYFLAASLIFPRSEGDWKNLDEHYWARKRLVVAGVLAVNLPVFALQLSRVTPRLSDGWFFFYQLPYYGALAAMLFTRSRRFDLALLAILIVNMLIASFDLLPGSQWAREVGVGFQPSTSLVAPPR
jgi:hypothetical protein